MQYIHLIALNEGLSCVRRSQAGRDEMLLLLPLQAFLSQSHGIILKQNKQKAVLVDAELFKSRCTPGLFQFLKTIPPSPVIAKGLREAGEMCGAPRVRLALNAAAAHAHSDKNDSLP